MSGPGTALDPAAALTCEYDGEAKRVCATGDPESARSMAAILGEELGLLNIHADFAPVVDINNNPANPVIGSRSFSDDPQTVSAFGCAYLAGLHEQGIIAALKQ